ncbi:MAG: hypothetical protein GX101_06310 [Firmicutes bacterium]|jgi:hypothetical protein|nr:YusW family protein [Bacillota bacterium]NLO66288.1 hypothetical protein [Bacillota bacterium]
MDFRRYVPLVIIVVLAVAATVHGLRQQAAQPKQIQTQVAEAENTLEQISEFKLEIELRDGRDIEIEYSAQGRASTDHTGQRLFSDEAVEEIRQLVATLPPLTENRPLTIIQATLDHLEIDEGNVKEFELEYELEGDMERSIELEVDRDDNDD